MIRRSPVTALPARPTPFREYVLKVHSRCNLACDYCYMYELADQSARDARAEMDDVTFEQACRRIAEHAAAHALPSVRVILHGGEPMLLGADRLSHLATRLRTAMPRDIGVEISIQTNAVLIDEPAVDTLARAGIRIGVSLDGDRSANDRHRRYANGRSSHEASHAALELLRGRTEVFAGILCVVDLANDPIATYEALLQYAPPAVDFLLPHAHWGTPPPGHTGDTAPYGRWLATVFDRWYGAPVRETRVRLLEETVNLILGGNSHTEAIGLSPVTVVVINVDGSYEQVDTLRSTFPGAVDTGLSVFDHSLDDALSHPDVAARQRGVDGLADACRACPVHRVCGGGYYPHRYRPGHGFANPSVYCHDLRHLIEHVVDRLRRDLLAVRSPASGPSGRSVAEPAAERPEPEGAGTRI